MVDKRKYRVGKYLANAALFLFQIIALLHQTWLGCVLESLWRRPTSDCSTVTYVPPNLTKYHGYRDTCTLACGLAELRVSSGWSFS
ncbi:hypothetical protein F4778DRAFT_741748 [Xylariomycetidae sp. FL2044]|nr:hypothetical protein F4778DRAFT_741748 [Xylariomycetidae sp. FL2044]